MPLIGSSARRISDSSAAQSIVAMRKRVVSRSLADSGACVVVGASAQGSLQQAGAGASGFAVSVLVSMPGFETL